MVKSVFSFVGKQQTVFQSGHTTCIHWNIIQPWKRKKQCDSQPHGGPGGHYTKWSQRRTSTIWGRFHVEPKIWCKCTYLWDRSRLTDVENRLGVVSMGEGKDGLGVWDHQMQTVAARMDKQQGPTEWHRELCSISGGKTLWKRIWKRMCIFFIFWNMKTESLWSTAEINTIF